MDGITRVEAEFLIAVSSGIDGETAGIVARARAGDAEAFHEIFKRYSKPIFSFIYHMVGERAVSEDLTQETFVRAYCKLSSIRDEGQLSTWLFGIARNVVRESIKQKYRSALKVGLEEAVRAQVRDERAGPDERLIKEELRRAIQSALGGLSEDRRAIFVLRVFQQMSYQEVARITGFSIGKLKTDLHRARLDMRRRLRGHFGRADDSE